ncbi:uncharacterized protein LOC130933684 [Arachis stenosperma]|uniref:uncharacterized protein LOC130933684 n=1 Tax=Arachis stenosperma TaxID=217475 RepID=UPI0025AC4052|nr:uncharacterized protein LOC130933684 [Arachis stenosperma]
MATWEDLENDTSSESSDQKAQLCLMADHDNENEVDLSDLSIDELYYIIKDISVNSKKLLDKYAKCKKENEALRIENDLLLKKVKANKTGNEKFLKKENTALRAELEKFKLKHEVTTSTDLISENKKLNEQIKNLNEDLAKFVQGSQNLNKLLASQRKSDCRVINEKTKAVLFIAKRSDNIYGITLDDLKVQNVTCFSSMETEKWMWHKRLGHASMFQISKLVKRGLVRGLPNIKFDKDIICDVCQMGKQIKTSFKPKEDVSTKKLLELLHLDVWTN